MSMDISCAPLVADSFCYEMDFMLSISDNNQEDVVDKKSILPQDI